MPGQLRVNEIATEMGALFFKFPHGYRQPKEQLSERIRVRIQVFGPN